MLTLLLDKLGLPFRAPARDLPFAQKRLALSLVSDSVLKIDRDGRLAYFNDTAATLFQLQPTCLGKHIDSCLCVQADDDMDAARVPLGEDLHQALTLPADAVVLLAGGVLLPVEGQRTPVPGEGALLILRDVTEQRRSRRWLAFQATHDTLTALLNRAEMEKRIAYTLEQARSGGRASLLYIDLDQFKVINDTCGHPAGDEFLRLAGKALHGRLRPIDTLARLGGDEFAVLVPGRGAEECRELAEQLIQAVQQIRFRCEQRVYRCSASVGIVEINARTRDWREVLSLADSACYMAKDRGRGRAWIAREDDRRLRDRRQQMDWIARLTRALEEDRLLLYRQPIVPLQGRDAAHCEVLIRLREDDGIAQPEQFIPAAERYGLMPEIDRRVTGAVFARLASPGSDRSHAVSINLSGTTLSDREFIRYIRSGFEQHRLDPARICFEITETAAATDFDAAVRFVEAVRRLGCRVSLDDFGKGASSFSYLKAFNVDFLKIDGSFVRDMDVDEMNAHFVESIHGLGKRLGLATIAEFVESAPVIDRLRQLGVDYVQGNYIGRPRPWLTGQA